MIDNYEHYISKNIKLFYKRRLVAPMIYLVLLVTMWFVFPLQNMLRPVPIMETDSFQEVYKHSKHYVKTTFTDLHFTGYTSERGNKTKGYYYYTIKNDKCAIVLLRPDACEEGLPVIESISASGKIIRGGETYKNLLNTLAMDLEWTPEGLTKYTETYYFSQPDYQVTFLTILFVFYFGSLIYTICNLVHHILVITFPFLAPACQNLVVFGHPRQMLEEAEEELATLPQLATEDMFITEHYFILTSPNGNAIVPIQEIVWIYKHSTLHKFLWYHFSISYTLHISANKHLYVQLPKNTKSDIDGIMDYLAEANHDILVGFNEENRLKVQETQGKPFHIEQLIALLRRKI